MSEVARLRRLIELECEALQHLRTGFAVTSSHEIINHRYDGIATAQQQLAAIVGEQEATRMAVEIYMRVME
ncbi:MAG: hypothetical protein JOZ18_19745 [Chloroflexi bacterium]|nr:hypothetical protein [Chloroflexota bacterium]